MEAGLVRSPVGAEAEGGEADAEESEDQKQSEEYREDQDPQSDPKDGAVLLEYFNDGHGSGEEEE